MFEATLRDGTPAVVLRLQRSDKDQLVAGFEDLSDEARRQRFLAPTSHLSESMLAHLVDDVDFVDHVAYVLSIPSEDDPSRFDPVAIGRMIRYEDAPDTADVAVTVKENLQGRGIASALLEVLVEQRPVGVERILTEVVSGNPASLAMLKRLGPTTVEGNGYGGFEVEIELWAAGAVAPPEEAAPAPDAAPRGPSIALTRPRPDDESRRRPRVDRRQQRAFQTRDAVCPWL